MQRDELLGYYILTRGWTTREIVAQAFEWRRQERDKSEDLAGLLQVSGILTPVQVQEARAEVAIALQDQLPTKPIRNASQQVQAHIEQQKQKIAADRPDKGDILGDYEILGALSEGNMGYVLRARDSRSGASAAIKLVSPKAAGQIENARFEREVRVLSALNHPNIVAVKGSGHWNERPYLVMELIQGESFESRVRAHVRLHSAAPELSETIPKLRDLAEALRCIHGAEIIHRDFKPQNAVIEESSGRAVLIDFGLIRANTESQNLAGLTQTHEILGTPAYMSPEQFMPGGRYGDVTSASDIWAFGASAWFAFTGESPFARGSLVETLEAVLYHELPPLAELNAAVPPALSELIARCLRREPIERPAAEELCRCLQGFDSYQARPSKKRPSSLWRAALALAVPALALIVLFFVVNRDKTPPVLRIDGALVDGRYVDLDSIRGQVSDDVGATLSVDGQDFPLDSEGRFEIPVGRESMELIARDASGKVCQQTIRVLNSAQWSAYIRGAIGSLQAWQALSPEAREAVAQSLARRLGAGWQVLPELETGLEPRGPEPARLIYRGIIFRLIPGGRLRVGLLSGPSLLQLEYRMLLAFLEQSALSAEDLKWFMRERSKRETIESGRNLKMPFPPGAQQGDPDLIPRVCELRFKEVAKGLQRSNLELRIEPFLLAENELTCGLWSSAASSDKDSIPVTDVTGIECLAWLEDRGMRLPDRGEWQYAARGGATSPLFWGTNASDGRWVYRGPSPLPNDERRRNGFGLVDMIGNVREWAIPVRKSRDLQTGLRLRHIPPVEPDEELVLMSPPGLFPLWAACPYIFEYAKASEKLADVGIRPAFSLPPF